MSRQRRAIRVVTEFVTARDCIAARTGYGVAMPDDPHLQHDPANPTIEERLETARSEGVMAREDETDPEFIDERDPADVPEPEVG